MHKKKSTHAARVPEDEQSGEKRKDPKDGNDDAKPAPVLTKKEIQMSIDDVKYMSSGQ